MKNNKLVSSRSVSMRDINALLQSASISRIKTLRNDEECRGFTLIELLIVVLIIGVLAAIAVSAYNRSLVKSRFSAVMPPTKSLADSQEFYYLNHGEYATDKNELDVAVSDTPTTTFTLSEKQNYKYVLGHNDKVPGANYIVYQKRSKRFAGNIHCEAEKDNAAAQWLCETALGGILLTGSISGSNWLTYLISGDAGTDKFLREDCRAGYYDKDGACTAAPAGYYAEDGEISICPAGTYTGVFSGATSCQKCPAGRYSTGGAGPSCTACEAGTYSEPGSSSCTQCPAGTYTGVFSGAKSCQKCPAGQYSTGGAGPSCTACGAGKTNNTDHTGCVAI